MACSFWNPCYKSNFFRFWVFSWENFKLVINLYVLIYLRLSKRRISFHSVFRASIRKHVKFPAAFLKMDIRLAPFVASQSFLFLQKQLHIYVFHSNFFSFLNLLFWERFTLWVSYFYFAASVKIIFKLFSLKGKRIFVISVLKNFLTFLDGLIDFPFLL